MTTTAEMISSRNNPAAVFSITCEGSDDVALSDGLRNRAYVVSTSDLPDAVFQNMEGNNQSINSTQGLGLGSCDADQLDDSDNDDIQVQNQALMCHDHHSPRQAKYFCVHCLIFICEHCHQIHHKAHNTVQITSERQTPSEDILDAYRGVIEQRSGYQKALSEERYKLDSKLEEALRDVDKLYDEIITRVNQSKAEAVLKVKAAISEQQQLISEKLDDNQNIIDSCHNILKSELWPPTQQSVQSIAPTAMVIPSVTLEVVVPEFTVPESNLVCKTEATSLKLVEEVPQELEVNRVTSIGSKGSEMLQFRLPGGVCIDKQNTVYVVDEGNNRIQRLANDGSCLGTFTWGNTGAVITDVAYDPSTDRLVVPRAYSQHGLLKCHTFSCVTLDGCEVSRFTVPNMKGGLLVSCSRQGHLIITDIVKRSVSIIVDGHLHLEIQSQEHLKEPARCIMGRNGDIIIVDKARQVIAVFDKGGMYVRDIGTPEDLRKPSGLAIDLNCGVIAVTDWCGDKLVFYSYSGSKLASYGGFKCPHSVSINNNHKVIVTDSWNNQLNVLHYQPKI